ncbi:MAG: hypothetical protein AAF560_20220 [Acidobacteriota bacterium]
MQRLLILDDTCDLTEIEELLATGFTHVFLLCWLAPETRERLLASHELHVADLLEIVDGQRSWELRAARLVDAVCDGGPKRQGRPWREFLRESLFREARSVQAILDAFRLAHEQLDHEQLDRDRLANDRIERDRIDPKQPFEVHLRIRTDSERLFRTLAEHTELASAIRSQPRPASPARASLPRRIARRLRQAMLKGNWRDLVLMLATQADLDYRYRMRWGRWLPAPKNEMGGATLFSSYLNNSRTLSKLAPLLPADATWVVTSQPAKREIAGRRSGIHDLWRFAPSQQPDWLRSAQDQETFDPSDPDSLTEQEKRIVAAWLGQSPTWRYWRDAGFQTLLNLTACWERYLEQAKPRLVAIASPWGIEGWLAHIAQERGAAVVELLHGVLGGPFFTEGPLAADALVVWGDFWRQQRPEPQRSKIHVFNPGITATRAPSSTRSGKPRVTYISWPLDRAELYHADELLDGFIDIFDSVVREQRCELTVRGHPLENLTDLTQRWQQRFGAVPEGVHFSQFEPLAEVLQHTDIAIMFRSTVLLDCLACDIPVLIPGWIEFDWSERLEAIPGIRLAQDFTGLKRGLEEWIQAPPRLDRRSSQHFLRPAGEGEDAFRDELARLFETRPGRAESAPTLEGSLASAR